MKSQAVKKTNLREDIENILQSKLNAKSEQKQANCNPEFFARFKRELVWNFGRTETMRALTRFGYSCGQSDGTNSIFSHSLLNGVGTFSISACDKDGPPIEIEVEKSIEAQAYSNFNIDKSSGPQCHIIAGYLTGLLSSFSNQYILFAEDKCIAKGDDVCQFTGRKKVDWETSNLDLIEMYKENNMALELDNVLEQLKGTKDRYQNLFEQSSVPIFIIDPETGAILNNNLASETITGYSKEELFKMKIFEIYRPEDYEHVVKHIKQINSMNNEMEAEMSILTKDKKVRYVAQSSKTLTYGNRFVIQTIMRDITNIKISHQIENDLQKQLIRNERFTSIGRLAAGMAHELKNPLGAIGNALYYIRTTLSDNPIMKSDEHLGKMIKTAEEEVGTSVAIIGELLDFSKEIHLVLKASKVNDIITKISKKLNVPDHVKLRLDLDPSLPEIMLDEARLHKVFEGIVENSVQALSKRGGRIIISSRLEVGIRSSDTESSEHVAITFEDNGPGIDPEILPKIFEPLFTTKTRGTGLGLAISHNIIEKHGGTISATSQKNKRTRFTINLPIKPIASEEKNNDNE